MITKYIEKLIENIDELIYVESTHGLSRQREDTLFVLFQNLKSAREYLAERRERFCSDKDGVGN